MIFQLIRLCLRIIQNIALIVCNCDPCSIDLFYIAFQIIQSGCFDTGPNVFHLIPHTLFHKYVKLVIHDKACSQKGQKNRQDYKKASVI